MKKNINKTENKKLYKNWKLYATALAILAIGTGTGLGIYFGTSNHSHHEAKKTDLNNLELNKILSIPVTNQTAAFDLFIKSNATITDLKDNLEIVNYNPSDYNKLGTLEVQGKANSKYTGSITITIPEKNQTNLNQLIANTTIQGTETMTEQEAFNAFLTANNSWANLSDFVEYSSFTAVNYESNGSLTITAKANTAFTGSLTVSITKLAQSDLKTLNLNSVIAVDENATQEATFQAFLDKNQNILGNNLTLDQVELSNFKNPEITADGTLTITVKTGINSKYTGSISIDTKYILSSSNLPKVIRYLSDNNLLNFQLPTGTQLGVGNSNLLAVLINVFRQFMNGTYENASNIKDVALKTYNWGPSQAQLNTKGFVWAPPKNSTLPDGTKVSSLFIIATITYTNGTTEEVKITNLNATITMV